MLPTSSARSKPKPKGLFILNSRDYPRIYGEAEVREIQELVELYAPPQTKETVSADPSILKDAEVILSGWGCPTFDEHLLDAAPALKVILYGAGSIKYIVTEAFWKRNIQISTAYVANDIPVAEFTLAQILLGLKGYWHYVYSFKKDGTWYEHLTTAGIYGSTVGLISLGMIGRMVAEKLKNYQVKVLAYDPYVKPEAARQLGVELCPLETIFAESDVVSLHTPWLPETEGMIKGVHFTAMKPSSTFINTARGAVVNEAEMIEVLCKRPDVFALLDVTYPEPPVADSPLQTLPNVVITPHIAGANTNECKRNGQYVIAELKRYLNGEALLFAVTEQQAKIMA